jgi:hypothetical protein
MLRMAKVPSSQTVLLTVLPQEDIMKVLKNLEGAFVAAVAVCSLAMYATADEAPRQATAPAMVSTSPDMGAMQVVVVKAKRLTAAEKAAGN